MPTIFLEAGYSESHSDLKEDVRLFLLGSGGAIGRVVLVKVDRLFPGETIPSKGFVELWGLVDDEPKRMRSWAMHILGCSRS